MNSVEIIGNLVKKPIYKEYESEDKTVRVAKYTIAAQRNGKKEEADFISCTAFGNDAVYASKYMDKGDLIAVEGNLHSSSYMDKDGNARYGLCVYVSHNQNYTSRKNKELIQIAEENERKINDAIDSLNSSCNDNIPEYEFGDAMEGVPFE